jgi:hypothetical protein
MLIHFPIEMVLLSHLTGKIFVKLNISSPKNRYKAAVKFIMFFFLSYFVVELCIIIRDTYDSCVVPELEKKIRQSMIDFIVKKNEIHNDNLDMDQQSQEFWDQF